MVCLSRAGVRGPAAIRPLCCRIGRSRRWQGSGEGRKYWFRDRLYCPGCNDPIVRNRNWSRPSINCTVDAPSEFESGTDIQSSATHFLVSSLSRLRTEITRAAGVMNNQGASRKNRIYSVVNRIQQDQSVSKILSEREVYDLLILKRAVKE